MPEQFHSGDNISATCNVCGVGVEEPLTGRYDPRLAEEALDRVSAWMQAHMEEFHPDLNGGR